MNEGGKTLNGGKYKKENCMRLKDYVHRYQEKNKQYKRLRNFSKPSNKHEHDQFELLQPSNLDGGEFSSTSEKLDQKFHLNSSIGSICQLPAALTLKRFPIKKRVSKI